MYATLFDRKGRVRFRDVQAPDYASDRDGLLLLTLTGPEQAVRACWANIVKKRTKRSVTKTELKLRDGTKEFWVKVNPLLRYHMEGIPGGLIVLRQEFNRLSNRCILGGDEDTPSPWFEAAMKQLPTIPYRKEWLPELWQRGIEGGLIQRVEGHAGIAVWQVSAHAARWAKLVKDSVKEGVCG